MKTAEEILKNHLDLTIKEELPKKHRLMVFADEIIDCMEEYCDSYHEAKLKEITDADIEAWAEKVAIITTGKSKHGYIIKAALYTGAKAMRNNEIEHIK